MNGNVVQFEDALNEGLIVPNMLTATSAYDSQRQEYVLQRQLLTALKQGDAERYLSLTYRPASAQKKEAQGLEQIVFSVMGYEQEQAYQAAKNQAYLDQFKRINFHMVHERTSWQQIHLFIIGMGPVLLLLGLIFLISDVHVKDRELQTQKIAQPIRWQKYLFLQALTALTFVGIFYLSLFILFFIVNGIQYGFGSLSFPIGYHENVFDQGYLNLENYQVRTIAWFVLRAIPILILLSYFFTC